eukprot:scaffold197289_cov18-Tisochrysis_lutea.AAC.1
MSPDRKAYPDLQVGVCHCSWSEFVMNERNHGLKLEMRALFTGLGTCMEMVSTADNSTLLPFAQAFADECSVCWYVIVLTICTGAQVVSNLEQVLASIGACTNSVSWQFISYQRFSRPPMPRDKKCQGFACLEPVHFAGAACRLRGPELASYLRYCKEVVFGGAQPPPGLSDLSNFLGRMARLETGTDGHLNPAAAMQTGHGLGSSMDAEEEGYAEMQLNTRQGAAGSGAASEPHQEQYQEACAAAAAAAGEPASCTRVHSQPH